MHTLSYNQVARCTAVVPSAEARSHLGLRVRRALQCGGNRCLESQHLYPAYFPWILYRTTSAPVPGWLARTDILIIGQILRSASWIFCLFHSEAFAPCEVRSERLYAQRHRYSIRLVSSVRVIVDHPQSRCTGGSGVYMRLDRQNQGALRSKCADQGTPSYRDVTRRSLTILSPLRRVNAGSSSAIAALCKIRRV